MPIDKKAAAPRAGHAEKPITPVMVEYVVWLKAETGYEVDPMSVQLSGQLRGQFQKSEANQARIARASEKAQAEAAARAERRAQRAEATSAKVQKPKAEKAVAAKATTSRRRRPASTAKAESS